MSRYFTKFIKCKAPKNKLQEAIYNLLCEKSNMILDDESELEFYISQFINRISKLNVENPKCTKVHCHTVHSESGVILYDAYLYQLDIYKAKE